MISENSIISSVKDEHYVLVDEPGCFYLTHTSPEDGTASSIANTIFNPFKNTELHQNLAIVGADSTNVMTGLHQGVIRQLEVLVERPLQWCVCLLHLNELPLRHVFRELDGSTSGPASFSGKLGKSLDSLVSDWPVVAFQAIQNNGFPVVPEDVLDDMSTDQVYAYQICHAVIQGSVDDDLRLREIGPI